jgi:hypothetical protein
MRTQELIVTATILMGGTACSTTSNDTMTGVRGDGVTVECAQASDGVSTCTPEDGDDHCESWEEGGAATVLWPPNHKLIRFTLADCAGVQSGCDGGGDGGGDGGVILLRANAAPPADAHITSITSDEAVEVGAGGDGHTASYDVAIIDPVTFDLRSERQGGGDGRVYRVNYVDSAGVTGSCEFLVPHDQGPTSGAVDSGTVVTVTP